MRNKKKGPSIAAIAVARVAARTEQIRNVRQEAVVAGRPVPGGLLHKRTAVAPVFPVAVLVDKLLALLLGKNRRQIQHVVHDGVRPDVVVKLGQIDLVVRQLQILGQRKPHRYAQLRLDATLAVVCCCFAVE